LLNSNISSTCPRNMVNFGPLSAEIRWRVWGTPTNFNGFRVLAVLLHGTLVVDVSQTLRRWTEGATYIWRAAITIGVGPHSSSYIHAEIYYTIRFNYLVIMLCFRSFVNVQDYHFHGSRLVCDDPRCILPTMTSFIQSPFLTAQWRHTNIC